MFGEFAAVGIGAAFGAWLRWGFSTWLNPRLPHFPLGTLAANSPNIRAFYAGFTG